MWGLRQELDSRVRRVPEVRVLLLDANFGRGELQSFRPALRSVVHRQHHDARSVDGIGNDKRRACDDLVESR
jgi:hypothetical protein